MIILTGSEGFIGKNFKEKLSDVIEVEKNNCWEFLVNFEGWSDVDQIIHQGANSNTTEISVKNLYYYNTEFTIELFERAIQHGIPVKYASTAALYGNGHGPMNQYALSKLQIDYWVNDNIDKFNHIQGFRYFNVYGKHEDHKEGQASPVHTFSKQAKNNGVINIFENSHLYYRDFVWVGDLVDVVLNNQEESGIYDLGTSKPISFLNVAELVANKYGADIKEIPFPDHLKEKYQTYTCSSYEWPYNFISVKDYLNG